MPRTHTNTTINSSVIAGIIDDLDQDFDLIGTDDDDGISVDLAPVVKETKKTKKETKPVVQVDEEIEELEAAPIDEVTTPVEPKGPTKMDLARDIFKAEYGKSPRKDVIAKFITIGCTKAGAATYYQNLTKAVKDGKLVIPKTEVTDEE